MKEIIPIILAVALGLAVGVGATLMFKTPTAVSVADTIITRATSQEMQDRIKASSEEQIRQACEQINK